MGRYKIGRPTTFLGQTMLFIWHVLLVISDVGMLFKHLVTRIFTKNKEMSFVCFANVLE